MLNEKKPSEWLSDWRHENRGKYSGEHAEYDLGLDALEAYACELHTTVTEHARALAGGAVAEVSEGDALSTGTIAQLTRERDEARSERDAVADILGKSNDANAQLLADRDRLQGELATVRGELEEARKDHADWERTAGHHEAQLATRDRELHDATCKLDALEASNAGLMGVVASLRAQSSDGLREAVTAERDRLAARAGGLTALGGEKLRLLSELLAAHPAPSPGSPADGDRVATSDEAEGRPDLRIAFGDKGQRWLATPSMPLTIGAHTMTVAEWEALAKERGEYKHACAIEKRDLSQQLTTLHRENESLRARVEKADHDASTFLAFLRSCKLNGHVLNHDYAIEKVEWILESTAPTPEKASGAVIEGLAAPERCETKADRDAKTYVPWSDCGGAEGWERSGPAA